MKYYQIWKRCEPGCAYVEPAFIVESKEVAEHFCSQNSNWYYFSEHDTEDKF